MVALEDAKRQINEALATIDGYAKQIISDIIKWRLKRVEASRLVLQKFREKFLDNWQLTYKQKDIHKRKVVLSKGNIEAKSAILPSIQLAYNADVGKYMTLEHEEGTIGVPHVDVFVYEPIPIDNLFIEYSKQIMRDAILLKFAVDTDIAEEPDYKNDYAKYYRLNFIEEKYFFGWIGDYSGKPLPLAGVEISFDRYWIRYYTLFGRNLTIAGSQYEFKCYIYRGSLDFNMKAPDGTVSKSRTDAIAVEFITNYDADFSWVASGREFDRGETKDTNLVKHVLIMYWNGTMFIHELN